MLSRDRIISTALLKLGEVSVYNDNRSEVYSIANSLLNNVLDTIASRNDFLFNSTTTKLTVYGKDEDGEVIYNIPVDFLNKIEFVNGSGRIENEFIYSNDENLELRYCRKINFNEFPDYLFNYLVYALATDMTETYNQYTDRLSILNTRLEQERNNIYAIEFTPRVKKV